MTNPICFLTAVCLLLVASFAQADDAPATLAPAEPSPVATEAAAPQVDASPAAPAATASETAAAPATILLRYKHTPGQVLRYSITDETTLEVDAGGESATMNYSSRTWKHLRVKSATAGGRAVLELMIDRVQMQATGPAGEKRFDSREPGLPPTEFAQIVSVVGRPIADLTLTDTGRIVDLRDPGQKATKETMVSLESLERDNTGPVLLPEQPVAVGERWTEQIEVPVLVGEGTLTRKVALQRAYTLVSVEQDIATIELDTIVLSPIQDPAISAQLIQRTPSGIILFDLQQGVVASRRTFLSNQVVGHEGAASRLKVVRNYVERLTTEDESLTAAKLSATR